ncbi:MAG: class I SAM-dependent methyltransferase [Deltaproteobacteria bacterium]|nr:class I SAM-dependent methyltransferase [Deltaproteobacteria bacterium]
MSDSAADPRRLYVELLRSALLGQLIQDRSALRLDEGWRGLLRTTRFKGEIRARGRDFPSMAHTMIGEMRLQQLQHAIEDVLAANVPGDLIETGVWRGGATIFMRGMLKAYDVRDRTVWVADSFEGLPRPNPLRYPADRWLRFDLLDIMRVSLEEVRGNFERYGLLDDQVRFLKGWFRDSLPAAPIDRLAVLRLDGDLYESTYDALQHLYPKLSVGGYAIIDDLNIGACRQAVDDYRRAHGIAEPIHDIDGWGGYWKRERAPS